MTTTSEMKRLTIYKLESAPIDDQVRIALLLCRTENEKDENNFEIIDMIGDPERLRARVDEMDALLKARETGHKPEMLKTIFSNNKKRRNKKKKKFID